MIRKYDNHKLQTNPWHREEEPHNNHEKPKKDDEDSQEGLRSSLSKIPSSSILLALGDFNLPHIDWDKTQIKTVVIINQYMNISLISYMIYFGADVQRTHQGQQHPGLLLNKSPKPCTKHKNTPLLIKGIMT